jgi:hypothetical protein
MPDTSGFKRDKDGAYIPKDPSAVLTYTIDYSSWLTSPNTLQTSVYTVSTIADDPAPLTVDAATISSDAYANVVLSGGTAGNIYTITNTITTDNADTDSRRFKVVCERRFI